MGNIRVGSAVLVTRDKKILLGQRGKEPNYGKWILPGGGIHDYESIADAARREILEETGLSIEYLQPVLVKEIIRDGEEHRLIIYSEATCSPTETPIASSDLLEVSFFSKERLEAIRSDLSPIVRDVLVETGWLHN